MQNIEQKIGYKFNNKLLLEQALTHSSITSNIHQNYERLEFLGDRILGLTIAELLYNTFPNEQEGEIACRFVNLVSKEAVSEVVTALGLKSFIRVQNEETRESLNVLCDVGEAIIAAIYLDSKDLSLAKTFIINNFQKLLDTKSRPHKDYKTLLQEQAYIKGYSIPQYTLIEKTGPEHEPTFLIEVTLGSDNKSLGSGKNKKQAEQNAAQKMLEHIGIQDV